MRYVPILKGKAAEYEALNHTFPATAAGCLPVVEVIPPSDETDPREVESACKKAVESLSKGWSGPIALDLVFIDGLSPTPSGLPVEVVANTARLVGLTFLPVVRLGDDPTLLAAVAGVVAADGNGAVVRLSDEDLAEDTLVLDGQFSQLKASLGLSDSDLDVILDFGAIDDGSMVNMAVRAARSLINGLAGSPNWRSLTIGSGAFPNNLNAIPAHGTGLISRLDSQFWVNVTGGSISRLPDYADYAIQHPVLSPPIPVSPAPQIRYNTGDSWRIRKGNKKSPRGHRQFYDICADIVASPEFANQLLSWGGAYIADAAKSAGGVELVGPGNATKWRAIGTSHHIASVVNRLATLSVP